MPQIINTNIASLTTQRNLNRTQGELNIALQRLSSGLRINSAKDDAAGLAISERFTTQIRGLNQAVRNANDGISFAQTAEGALSTVGSSLQRIRELAVQSVNDTNSAQDRQALNNEVQQLVAEVNRVASSTQFNGQNILDGTLEDLTFQVGANQNQTISVDGVDARGTQLGARTVDIASFSQASLDQLVAADTLFIQGTHIDLSAFTGTGTATDADLVAAINAESATTGVQALRGTTNSVDLNVLLTTAAGTSDQFVVNGVTVAYNLGTTTAITGDNLAAALTSLEDQTGLEAVSDGLGNVTLSNNSGQAIEFETNGSSVAAQFITANTAVNDITAAGATIYAGITLAGDVSDIGYSASVGAVFNSTDDATFDAQVAIANQTNNTLNGVDVLTGDSATDALLTLDFALQQVSGLRAELGAVQTRFESTITNLQVTSENLDAARSRIQDADFAQETAALTRAQILQQAGVSVLSQANALPQLALSLLQ